MLKQLELSSPSLPHNTKMRRISRINGPIDVLRSRATAQTPSPYLCLVCKHQATFVSTSSIRTPAKVPFTEKIRQKIWGTDQPPGLKDPYGDRSRFDQTKKRAQETEIEERKVAATPDLSNYEPATTWDSLERVGGFGHWWKENWDPDHQFVGFLPTEVMTEPDEITAALHRAMVEVFALQQAGRSLGDISKAVPGADMTLDVQINPSANGAALQFSNETSLEDVVQSLAVSVDEAAEKGAPTESEEDIAADRSSVDPLQPEATSGIDETSEKGNPTESEEDIAADRSTQDPLPSALAQTSSYDELIASWGPEWLQVSFDSPEVKFAVSVASNAFVLAPF